jgi:hypothetical protein
MLKRVRDVREPLGIWASEFPLQLIIWHILQAQRVDRLK